MIARLVAAAITAFARLVTAARPEWRGHPPDTQQRVYYANHRSHLDFLLLWSVLPGPVRRRTRPVAAADYWRATRLRRYLGERVFNAVLIQRGAEGREQDPIATMVAALDEGASLILFPEGTRNLTDAPLLDLRSGLYRVACQRLDLELMPVWLANLNRVLPKGEAVPVPLICTVTFGQPLRLDQEEGRDAFLTRARAELLALAPTRADA